MPATIEPPLPRGNPADQSTWQNVRTIEALERARQIRSTRQVEALTRYGQSFFEVSQDDLTKTENAVVLPDYQLRAGDQLNITTYNVKGGETQNQVTLDQNGEVYLPGAGPMNLAGLTPSAAQTAMDQRIQSRYPNMRVRMSMTQVRNIRVFLLGEINRPGGLLVNPSSTVLDALIAGGGPNEAGTYRKIQLQRNGAIIAHFDLYDLLIHGRQGSPRLLEGDRIFVPVSGPQVAISGEVFRPAIYELRGETTLAQLIRLAGGVRPEAYAANAQLERIANNTNRVIQDIPLERAARTRLQAGDFFIIQQVLDDLANGVYLDGAVRRPGWYSLRGGQMTVSQLIGLAQGLKEGAFSGHAELYRLDGPDQPIRVIGFELGLALMGDPKNDLKLQPQDRVIVSARTIAEFNRERVRIQGEVSRPGEYPRFANMRIRDLLYQAGGLTPTASTVAEIARRGKDGQLQIIPVNLETVLVSPDSPDNIALGDLDVLYVREELRAREWPAFVTIAGEVNKPGVYAIDPQRDTLRDVIARAGGLTDKAYPKGTVFTRNKADIMLPQHEELTELIFSNIETVARQIAAVEAARQNKASSTPASNLTSLAGDTAVSMPRVINRILATKRIPINLEYLLRTGKTDPGTRGGDIIFVPAEPTTVVVAGAVVNPSALLFRPGRRASDYIEHSGGFTKDADEDETYILRVNGEVLKSERVGSLEPGDVVLVPPRAIIAVPGAFERFLSILQVAVSGAAIWQLFTR